jgi:long-chain acyl-CoA synthetase
VSSVWREVEAVARARGAHPAIRFEGETITYASLVHEVERVSASLAGAGVKQGDRVCLLLPNTPAFPVAYYAVVRLGAIAVSVNVMCKPDEVRHIVVDSGALAVVVAPELAGSLPPRDEVPSLRHVFVGLDTLRDSAAGEAATARASVPEVVDLPRDAPVAILYTSGTTGKPKGAVLSHGNVISNAHTARHVTGMSRSDVPLCFVPLFHCFGQTVLLHATLLSGATLVLERRFAPEPVLRTVEKEGVTMLFAVPTAYIALLAEPRMAAALRGLRYAFSAAAILPVRVEQAFFAATGLHVHEGYGLTETSPFASYNHVWRWKSGSVGAPVENVEMAVKDEHGRALGDGEVGELCIRGPNVMLGYWGRPEETALAVEDGWFHSGDIGYRDADGDYFIVDRVKDMINTAGFKVWPREVEEVLFGHPDVHDAAVVGVPDDYAGEAVKAFLVPRQGVTLDVASVIAACNERLSTYKVPKHVEVVAAIPKGATGKTLKKDLRAR